MEWLDGLDGTASFTLAIAILELQVGDSCLANVFDCIFSVLTDLAGIVH